MTPAERERERETFKTRTTHYPFSNDRLVQRLVLMRPLGEMCGCG